MLQIGRSQGDQSRRRSVLAWPIHEPHGPQLLPEPELESLARLLNEPRAKLAERPEKGGQSVWGVRERVSEMCVCVCTMCVNERVRERERGRAWAQAQARLHI